MSIWEANFYWEPGAGITREVGRPPEGQSELKVSNVAAVAIQASGISKTTETGQENKEGSNGVIIPYDGTERPEHLAGVIEPHEIPTARLELPA